mmetsp:Transcript_12730/g.32787  ORF Transcript_12730/g.32787 Transcript_12730/m.32787 type:complete len:495 (+) Transcript_12730:406-1890(+)
MGSLVPFVALLLPLIPPGHDQHPVGVVHVGVAPVVLRVFPATALARWHTEVDEELVRGVKILVLGKAAVYHEPLVLEAVPVGQVRGDVEVQGDVAGDVKVPHLGAHPGVVCVAHVVAVAIGEGNALFLKSLVGKHLPAAVAEDAVELGEVIDVIFGAAIHPLHVLHHQLAHKVEKILVGGELCILCRVGAHPPRQRQLVVVVKARGGDGAAHEHLRPFARSCLGPRDTGVDGEVLPPLPKDAPPREPRPSIGILLGIVGLRFLPHRGRGAREERLVGAFARLVFAPFRGPRNLVVGNIEARGEARLRLAGLDVLDGLPLLDKRLPLFLEAPVLPERLLAVLPRHVEQPLDRLRRVLWAPVLAQVLPRNLAGLPFALQGLAPPPLSVGRAVGRLIRVHIDLQGPPRPAAALAGRQAAARTGGLGPHAVDGRVAVRHGPLHAGAALRVHAVAAPPHPAASHAVILGEGGDVPSAPLRAAAANRGGGEVSRVDGAAL